MSFEAPIDWIVAVVALASVACMFFMPRRYETAGVMAIVYLVASATQVYAGSHTWGMYASFVVGVLCLGYWLLQRLAKGSDDAA